MGLWLSGRNPLLSVAEADYGDGYVATSLEASSWRVCKWMFDGVSLVGGVVDVGVAARGTIAGGGPVRWEQDSSWLGWRFCATYVAVLSARLTHPIGDGWLLCQGSGPG
jgi:hypothetical protein